MLAMLEAAWPKFEGFFGDAPRLRRGNKLQIRFVETFAAFTEAIREGGGSPPSSAGGYYCPSSEAVYLFRQPTEFYTRCLLLHEAAHQFHYLAKSIGSGVSGWYKEGVAEHLCVHEWDGKTLGLGVLRRTLQDYPRKALESLTETPRALVAMVENGQQNRPLGMMLIRHISNIDTQRFRRFTRQMDKGEDSEKIFRRYYGDLDDFEKEFTAWVRENQEPPGTPAG